MIERNYNVTGAERKALVNKIAELTGQNAVYLGMPSVAFKVGNYEISRTGRLTWEDDTSKYEVASLICGLREAGFTAEEDRCTALAIIPSETAQNAAETAGSTPVENDEGGSGTTLETAQEAPERLSISLPDDLTDTQFALLQRLVAGKETLLKHAFKADSVPVERSDGKLTFPWFIASDGVHTEAYMVFLTKLIKFAKKASRVTVHDQPVDNEKFSFRVFLIRLDLIGEEYKGARKILLENLTGNSAWRNGDPKKRSK